MSAKNKKIKKSSNEYQILYTPPPRLRGTFLYLRYMQERFNEGEKVLYIDTEKSIKLKDMDIEI